MGLTKIRKRRAIKEAKKKLIDIISHISDLTEIDWAKKRCSTFGKERLVRICCHNKRKQIGIFNTRFK